MLKILTAMLVMAAAGSALGTITEPPDFPDFPAGPGEIYPGGEYLLATGHLDPGDVDWVQVTLPADVDNFIIDVDVPGLAGDSLITVWVDDLWWGDNDDDLNDPALDWMGVMDNEFDSAFETGMLEAGDYIDIGITGAGDWFFNGDHQEDFDYEVWVYAVPAPSSAFLLGLGLLARRRR